MLPRLDDALLDSCRCDVAAPLPGHPARDFGLDPDDCQQRFEVLKRYLDEQQQLLWANRHQALLLWLQGPDCSGKDGAIRHLFRGLNPQGVDVSNFQLPSTAERQSNREVRNLPRLSWRLLFLLSYQLASRVIWKPKGRAQQG